MCAKKRILHLEDMPDWVREVKIALEPDYVVKSAPSLEEAAALYREEPSFDLAIIDISLELLDPFDEKGIQFLDALQRSALLPGNRIIVLSGYLDESRFKGRMRTLFRDHGVWDVLSKAEFDPYELKREVNIAIQTEQPYRNQPEASRPYQGFHDESGEKIVDEQES